jgi:hypothetical protein
MTGDMMQSTKNNKTEHKNPCPDCKMCQNCSDSRCSACRGDGPPKGKLSIQEQIALYDRLNPGLKRGSACGCKRHSDSLE